MFFLQFSPGYQPTVGVDYGFKIETVDNKERKYMEVVYILQTT